MSPVLEDPGWDSQRVQEALNQDFGRPGGSARPSFEDLTDNMSGTKARRHRQQRQWDMDSRDSLLRIHLHRCHRPRPLWPHLPPPRCCSSASGRLFNPG